MGEPIAKAMKDRSAAPPYSGGSSTSDLAGGVTGEVSPGFLVARLRTPRNPRVWFEILLIGVSYWLYSLIRNHVPEQRRDALRHAHTVWDFERDFGLGLEHSVNHSLNAVTWLIVGMNYFYATMHFVVTIGVLVWLYVRRPDRFRPARSVLFITTWVALLGFWLYPLAPPRLLPGAGFIDTVEVHDTWGSLSKGGLSHVSNQYAAMPSMHIGWSLWCGITVAALAARTWVRVLGALYPVLTLVVIVATGNHFWLDAVGGALCLAIGYAVAYLVYGRWAYRLPKEPERS
jgi:hypothetical protein